MFVEVPMAWHMMARPGRHQGLAALGAGLVGESELGTAGLLQKALWCCPCCEALIFAVMDGQANGHVT